MADFLAFLHRQQSTNTVSDNKVGNDGEVGHMVGVEGGQCKGGGLACEEAVIDFVPMVSIGSSCKLGEVQVVLIDSFADILTNVDQEYH